MRVSFLTTALVLSLGAASGLLGLREMQAFDNTAGANSAASLSWPSRSSLRAPAGRPTLLLFAHPLCGCTRATISELRAILAETNSGVDVRVFFEPENGLKAALWNEAQALPSSAVAWDEGGRIAADFGADTSGILKLYDASGTLRFEGGITSARGHEGRSPGGDALLAALRGNNGAGVSRFPVFGCALRGRRS